MGLTPESNRQDDRILVALSGGVDSSVAAALLKEQGYSVEGAYIRTWLDEEDLGECPAAQDIEDAEAAANHLGIPFRIVNLVRDYREKVVSYLVDGYRQGITPNPDIMCNREMKFRVFREVALQEGFPRIATGHYCRSEHTEEQAPLEGSLSLSPQSERRRKRPLLPPGTPPVMRTRILEGLDKNKDQSYFLALTRSEDLDSVEFPVGHLRKAEVREKASRLGLPNAKKKDSQGICFLGKVKIDEFLSRYIPDKPGEIVDTEGRVRGMHQGLHRFTIGQRKGIGVPSNTDNEAFVVVAKDLEKNHLVIGFDRPDTPLLYQTGASIGTLNWIGTPVTTGEKLAAKPRYRDVAQEITVVSSSPERIQVEFTEPQRALALGQILAFYRGEELIGGGTYEAVRHQKDFE